MDDIWIQRGKAFVNLPFNIHLAFGLVIRLLLIVYGHFHDQVFELQYTDIDYKVFTDAARHVINGESPYERHTYRYSPLIAFLLTPNILIHPFFGKIMFSFFDILISIACQQLVTRQLGSEGQNSKVPSYCAQLWIYNPMSIGISTRGNADSVPCFFIIMSLFILRTDLINNIFRRYLVSGFFLGLSIHLRLYPIAFSFPMFLSLGSYEAITSNTTLLNGLWLLIPNKKQLILTLSCIFTVAGFTYGMYYLYGYEFLFETYIYHFFRKDTRHNFSVMFYYNYLTMDETHFDSVKMIVVVFEALILFMLSLKFGVKQDSLPFAMFCQAVVLVSFNTVLTSQYFIWFLSLLPLVVHCFKMDSLQASYLASAWLICQAAWLFNAYLLEFRNMDVFLFVWLKSILFFLAHIYVLSHMIKAYRVGYGFGLVQYRRSGDKKNQ